MKTILYILLFITSFLNAQNQAKIISIQPTVICLGDSLELTYKAQAAGNQTLFILFDYGGVWWSDPIVVRTGNVNTTSQYIKWIKLPTQTPTGTINICGDICLPFTTNACNTVGIHKLFIGSSTPIYYDVQWKVIEDPYSEGRYKELIFKRVGDTYTKMMINP